MYSTYTLSEGEALTVCGASFGIHLINPGMGVLHTLAVAAYPADLLCLGSQSLELCFQRAVEVHVTEPRASKGGSGSSLLLAPILCDDTLRVWLEIVHPIGRHR